jgi:DNA-binding CsgD family transcriptional regulator
LAVSSSSVGVTGAGLVGREAELAVVDGFLGGVSEGAASLTLEGEAGIGKSALWEAAADRAEARGWVVLRSRGSQAEARFSFVGLCDLFAFVSETTLSVLPGPQRLALGVALARVEAGSAPADVRTSGLAVLSVLRELAGSAPVLVALDDVQWLDAASLALLGFALRRLQDEPVRVLVTVRTGSTGARGVDRSLAEERRQFLAVGPLSVAALQVMLRVRLGHSFSRPSMLRIAEVSGGNPFFALEIARELLRTGASATARALPVSVDLRALVSARLRRLSARTREELLAVAALSAASTGLVDPALLAPAEAAEVVRIGPAGEIVFTHPLFAAAIYASATPLGRRQVHARLADLVDDVEERAWHRALAAVGPDEAVAVGLEEGSGRARARGAWAAAAEMMERAVELTPEEDSEQRLRRNVRVALYRLQAGDREGAGLLLEDLLAVAPAGPKRGDVRRLLAEIRYSDGRFAEAAHLFEEALAETEDARLACIIELGLVYVNVTRLELAAAARHARRAGDLAAEAKADGTEAEALAFGAMVQFLRGRGIDHAAIERAVALEDPTWVVPLQGRPRTLAALLLLFEGRLAEARERLLEVWAWARERGEESDLAWMLSWLVWLETLAGDYRAASGVAEEALLLASMTGSASGRCLALAQRGLLRAHIGLVGESRDDCSEATALAERSELTFALPWIVAARCLLELSLGDAAAAWEAAEPLAGLAETLGIGEPMLVLFLPDALEALIELGETERAEPLLATFEAASVRLGWRWAIGTAARSRGLLLAASDRIEAAEIAFNQALDALEEASRPFELARTQLALGRLQRRRNERKTARETLADAAATFARLGAPLWEQKANAERARIGIRRAPEQLTQGERAAAELAAQGLKNREIAARLFVSARTVEANLARAYRKLGIRSRAQLSSALAEGRRASTLPPDRQ